MDLECMTWNLFHGRDAPPESGLGGFSARALGKTERGKTHLQVSGDLADRFHSLIADSPWDVCLLQECPPRWRASLEKACGAESHQSKTSRNWFGPVSGALARHRPDLIASWEGGSNLILARGAAGRIVAGGSAALTQLPERRTLALARLECGLAVGCLHLSTNRPKAASEALLAATAAIGWAGGAPLILGGDFNLRPGGDDTYETLAELGLEGTLEGSIDQLLVSGARAETPRQWEESEREVVVDDLALRPSDHAPVNRVLHLG
jgi:endonuclease/exonuclease/phosphatase family metal-dependent hydrolase